MYGLYLFSNIYSEGDIAAFTEEYIETLKDLLDDKVSVRILEFFEVFDASKAATDDNLFAEKLREKVQLMKDILLDSLYEQTFHYKVRERELIERVNIITVQSLSDLTGGVKEEEDLLEKITWLLDNKQYWISEIRPRNAESFKRLMDLTKDVESEARYLKELYEMHGIAEVIETSDNLRARIKANKIFFCATHEKSRSTGMGRITLHRKEIEMTKHALIYRKKCREMNISIINRRLPVKGA